HSEWRHLADGSRASGNQHLAIGGVFPVLSGTELGSGRRRKLSDFYISNQAGFVVLQTTCGSCARILNQVRAAASNLSEFNVVVLCVGGRKECEAAVGGGANIPVLSIDATETEPGVFAGLPAAYVVGTDGRVVHLLQNLESLVKLKNELERTF